MLEGATGAQLEACHHLHTLPTPPHSHGAAIPSCAALCPSLTSSPGALLWPCCGCASVSAVGRQSAVFPWYGSEAVGKLVPNAHTVFFEKANHWLYLEQPEAFNKLVGACIPCAMPSAPPCRRSGG